MQTRFRLLPLWGLLLPLALSTACVPEEDGEYADPSAAKQDNATGSRWRMPAEVTNIADVQHVDYSGAGDWTGQTCDAGITPGAEALTEYLLEKYPQILNIGGFSCRPIVGKPDKASVHSTGRALDIMLPVGFQAEAINGEGDPIGNFLVANAEDIGIQFVIWDRTSWGGHRQEGTKERYYGGAHPHNDHLHVELSEAAGRGETAWLQDGWTPVEPSGASEPATPAPPPQEPDPIEELPEEPSEDPPEEEAPSVPPAGELQEEEPQPTGTCASISAEGGVIDSEECIWLRGPANYWQHENEGHGGALAWTGAVQSGKHHSHAEWEIVLEEAGNYEVQVFALPEFATHKSTRYYLYHGPAVTPIEIDLTEGARNESPWVTLGTFAFAAGDSQRLVVFDNSDVAIDGTARIVVDAIRLVPEGEEPVEDPDAEDPNPDTGEEPSDDTPPSSDTDDEQAGRITSGCQSVPGGTPWATGLLLLFSFAYLRRRQQAVR